MARPMMEKIGDGRNMQYEARLRRKESDLKEVNHNPKSNGMPSEGLGTERKRTRT